MSSHHFGNKPFSQQDIPLDTIKLRSDHRPIDPSTVVKLDNSLGVEGLLSPITLSSRTGERVLICGGHRLAAARKREWVSIPAFVVAFKTETEERLCEISENLARAELSRLDRARQITEWRRLAGKPIAPASEESPEEDGEMEVTQLVSDTPLASVRETAKITGVNREDIRRSAVIDNITQQAEPVIRELGLENDQSALLAIANAVPTVEPTQVVSTEPTTPEEWRLFHLANAQIESARKRAADKEARRLADLAKPPLTPAQLRAAAETLDIKSGVLGLIVKFGEHKPVTLSHDAWQSHVEKILAAIKEAAKAKEMSDKKAADRTKSALVKPLRLTDNISDADREWINAGETQQAKRLKTQLDQHLSQSNYDKFMGWLKARHEAPAPDPVTATVDPAKLAALDASVTANKAAHATKGKLVTLANAITDDELAWINAGTGKLAKRLKTMLVSNGEMTTAELTGQLTELRTAMKAVVVNAKLKTDSPMTEIEREAVVACRS
jgi:hypothetical protein